MTVHPERRRFTRIQFDAKTELETGNGSWPVQLADISFKGLLLTSAAPLDLHIGDSAVAVIYLAGDELVMRLPATLTHLHDNHYGFSLKELEIEAMTHLRRLVELNLGDQRLFERELEQLQPAGEHRAG